MATERSETVAESVGETAGAAVEAVETGAAVAVAAAEQRAENAEAAAAAIADSVRAAAVTAQVEELQEDFDEWESAVNAKIAGLQTTTQNLSDLLSQLQTRVTEMENKPPAVAIVSSTPPTEPENPAPPPTEPQATVVTVQPANVSAEVIPVAPAPQKKRRLI